MFECVISKDCVVLFDVDFYFVFKVKIFEEFVNGGYVIVVLMFGWFLWFWFD